MKSLSLFFTVCLLVAATACKKDKPGNTDIQEIQIAAGGVHSLILKIDNTLWATGSNGDGQLGDGTKTKRYTPVKMYLQ